MTYQTGLLPDRGSARQQDRSTCLYQSTAGGSSNIIVQPIGRICAQPLFPSCAGQCLAACIEAIENSPPSPLSPPPSPRRVSGVSIWREARRRQGKIEAIDEGTRFEYAVAGLVFRGWDPYREGEDTCLEEGGLFAPDAGDDLEDEMFADDHRITGWKRYRILDDVLDSVDSALEKGHGVVLGTGTRPGYHAYRGDPNSVDPILTTAELGGDSGGHGQRIVGRVVSSTSSRIYLIQNSWTEQWGGCHLPNGDWQPGCCWVTEEVVRFAWDIHAVGRERGTGRGEQGTGNRERGKVAT